MASTIASHGRSKVATDAAPSVCNLRMLWGTFVRWRAMILEEETVGMLFSCVCVDETMRFSAAKPHESFAAGSKQSSGSSSRDVNGVDVGARATLASATQGAVTYRRPLKPSGLWIISR